MIDHRGRLLLVALAIATAAAAPAQANLIANGSFESGPTFSGDAVMLSGGSSAITGWVVTRANIDYCGPTRWSAAQGNYSIGLNGLAAGGIAQTFQTLNRAQYSVRFYMTGDPSSSPAIKSMRVAAAGQSADFSTDVTGYWAWDPGWDARMWSFTANSTTTTLEFYSLMSGDTGPTIDSVSVELSATAAVENPTLALSLSAIAPNPTRAASRVEFTVPETMTARLNVLDLSGREVAILADETFAPGRHSVIWDGRTSKGRASAGLYFVRLSANGRHIAQRLVVLR